MKVQIRKAKPLSDHALAEAFRAQIDAHWTRMHIARKWRDDKTAAGSTLHRLWSGIAALEKTDLRTLLDVVHEARKAERE